METVKQPRTKEQMVEQMINEVKKAFPKRSRLSILWDDAKEVVGVLTVTIGVCLMPAGILLTLLVAAGSGIALAIYLIRLALGY
jgi:hypothetical protein